MRRNRHGARLGHAAVPFDLDTFRIREPFDGRPREGAERDGGRELAWAFAGVPGHLAQDAPTTRFDLLAG